MCSACSEVDGAVWVAFFLVGVSAEDPGDAVQCRRVVVLDLQDAVILADCLVEAAEVSEKINEQNINYKTTILKAQDFWRLSCRVTHRV